MSIQEKRLFINHLLTHFQMTQLLHNVAIQEKKEKKTQEPQAIKKYAILLKEFLPFFFLFPSLGLPFPSSIILLLPFLDYHIAFLLNTPKEKRIYKRNHIGLSLHYITTFIFDQIPSTNCNSPIVVKRNNENK